MDEKENRTEKASVTTLPTMMPYSQPTSNIEKESSTKPNPTIDTDKLPLPTADLDSVHLSMAHSRLEGVTNTSLLYSSQSPQRDASITELAKEQSLHGVLNTTVEETSEP